MITPVFEVRVTDKRGRSYALSQHRCAKPAARSLASTVRGMMSDGGTIYHSACIWCSRDNATYSLAGFRAAMNVGKFDEPAYR